MLHSLPAGLSEDFATTQATEGESARSLVTHSSAGQAWTGRFANFRGSNARFPRSSSTSAATPASTSAEVPPFLDFRTNASREVLYTKCDEEADRWLNSSRTTMWALDAEWRPYVYPGKQGRMALIQLGDDKTVYLFHVIHMKKFPEALARILRDKRILKVGINIRNDGTKMLKDWGVGCASLVELGALYVQVADDLTSQRSVRSMASLTNELLGHSVEKTGPTRMGNWENKNLSALQLRYAANDAFVTYEVAEKIKELQQSRPPRDYEIELATIHSEGTKVVKDDNNKEMENSSKYRWFQPGRAQHKRRTGDVYIPNQLIPESLENKDILERNQTVWQEAGGRDLSNEITDDDSGENDWYLQQNQALFESLGQSTFNADQDRLEKKKRLK
ncbi:hypothetical protein BGZ68_006475 [Mortierella alpina]|nr:hypothetical protein BGZ68_006475 [Mortierella alpina]